MSNRTLDNSKSQRWQNLVHTMHCNTTSTIFIPSSIWNHLHSSVPICLINGVCSSAMRKHSLMDRTWSPVGMKGSSVFSRPPSRERYYSRLPALSLDNLRLQIRRQPKVRQFVRDIWQRANVRYRDKRAYSLELKVCRQKWCYVG